MIQEWDNCDADDNVKLYILLRAWTRSCGNANDCRMIRQDQLGRMRLFNVLIILPIPGSFCHHTK